MQSFFSVNPVYSCYINASRTVPNVISTIPVADFGVSFSLKTIREKAIVIRMLNLSIGTIYYSLRTLFR